MLKGSTLGAAPSQERGEEASKEKNNKEVTDVIKLLGNQQPLAQTTDHKASDKVAVGQVL